MKEQIIVLGGSGMLGSMLVDHLSRDPGLLVTATVRSKKLAEWGNARIPDARWTVFDADSSLSAGMALFNQQQWVLNAIGITKPLIREDDTSDMERAVRINCMLPYLIAQRAHETGARVLQIATDCVYSGSKGAYVESDPHDALDVYGKTKSLGEPPAPNFYNLRCSIIGPEPRDHKFLLDWLVSQPPDAVVNGYTNHWWNGLTTLHFAKICHAIITHNLMIPNVIHLTSNGKVTKFDMLESISDGYRRKDVSITRADADVAIDRTLSTNDEPQQHELWLKSGYQTPPSVHEMIAEIAAYDYRFADR